MGAELILIDRSIDICLLLEVTPSDTFEILKIRPRFAFLMKRLLADVIKCSCVDVHERCK